MKRHYLLQFLLLVLFPLFMVSCGDDDDDDISPNVAWLTAGEWTGDAIYFGNEDVTDEILEQEEFDFTQYTTEFEKDGSYVQTYLGTPVVEGDWEFQDNERTIVFNKDTDDEYSASVIKLDEDELFYLLDGLEFRFVR